MLEKEINRTFLRNFNKLLLEKLIENGIFLNITHIICQKKKRINRVGHTVKHLRASLKVFLLRILFINVKFKKKSYVCTFYMIYIIKCSGCLFLYIPFAVQ